MLAKLTVAAALTGSGGLPPKRLMRRLVIAEQRAALNHQRPSSSQSAGGFANMDHNHHDTPMLDELENGPWPSFVSGIKRLRDDHPDTRINGVANDLLGQLEHSYETRKGYWKGGTVSVFGYGGGIIPRFSEVGHAFPESKQFHTLRVQPPAGNHYTTDMLRRLADSWEKHGSGLVTFHGQTGNIMFIGATTENTQNFFDEINDYGWDLGGAGPCVRTGMSCIGAARRVAKCLAPTSKKSTVRWSITLLTTSIGPHCPTSSNSRFPAAPTTAKTPLSARTSPSSAPGAMTSASMPRKFKRSWPATGVNT